MTLSAERRERIKDPNQTISEAIFNLSEGNPGAIRVLAEIVKHGKEVDPYTEPFLLILHLDSNGVYGAHIWMLYKDVCGEDISKTVAAIRAVQLGFRTREQLHHAVENRGDGFDLEGALKQVKELLPDFKMA